MVGGMKRSSSPSRRSLFLVAVLAAVVGSGGWWALGGGSSEAVVVLAGGALSVEASGERAVEVLGLPDESAAVSSDMGSSSSEASLRTEVAAVKAARRSGKVFHATYALPRPKPTAAERREQLLALFLLDEAQIHDPAAHTAFVRGRLAIEADPAGAIDLMESHGVIESWLYAEVAGHARRRPESLAELAAYPEPAKDLWLRANTRALELDPARRDCMQNLIKADAALAAAFLEDVTAREGFEPNRGSRLNLAEAYLRAAQLGQGEELLAELFEQDPRDPDALELLRLGDPEVAEQHLRMLSEEDGGPWTVSLAELLSEDGRIEEMTTVLCEGLGKRPRDLDMVHALMDIAPGRAQGFLLSGYPIAEVDERLADEFAELAQRLELVGDLTGQVEAMRQVTLRSPLTDLGTVDWPEELEDEAPGLLIQALEMRWEPDSSLDFVGKLGTVYWRHGYEDEAKALWRSALETYPDEDAWQENLDAAAAGKAPPWSWR